jgi:small-conductance mechanosensitive channel
MAIPTKRIIITSIIGSILWLSLSTGTRAELTIEETRKLLQESLTITEIDREITRLSQDEQKVAHQIVDTQKSIVSQQVLVDNARIHAGKVLRSFYMGDRDGLWLLLLDSKSFSDAIVVYQYLQSIAENDQRALQKHQKAFQELKDLNSQLASTQSELQALKAQFIAQRIRVVQLQEQLDSKLAVLDNKEEILTQIDELSKAWRKDGLPLFQQFLQAMSEAMLDLPEFINEDNLEQDGTKFIFHINDKELNTFLRSKNALFENFIYTMSSEQISIKGSQDQINITINGHYAIENEPENALRFTLDELIYNGFTLPDTTRNDMQKQFSMTFYPKRFSGSLEATAVTQNPGELLIELTINP